jgi:L-ascorbate metabolism protein UlaG (beta-lactamase superfamily)
MKLFLLLAATVLTIHAARPEPEVFQTAGGPVRILPIRHASLMIEAGGKVLHVDPWSQGNYEGLPKADIILITDIHGDHFDPKIIEILRKPDTLVIGPPVVEEKMPGIAVLKNGQSLGGGDFHFLALPMYNEKRGPEPGRFYHEKGRGNGYVINFKGFRIYVAGDTEGVAEMRALREIDVAFIPMNLPNTMSPEEAADAVKVFRPKVVFPYHYRQSNTKFFADALVDTGIEVRLRDWYY